MPGLRVTDTKSTFSSFNSYKYKFLIKRLHYSFSFLMIYMVKSIRVVFIAVELICGKKVYESTQRHILQKKYRCMFLVEMLELDNDIWFLDKNMFLTFKRNQMENVSCYYDQLILHIIGKNKGSSSKAIIFSFTIVEYNEHRLSKTQKKKKKSK